MAYSPLCQTRSFVKKIAEPEGSCLSYPVFNHPLSDEGTRKHVARCEEMVPVRPTPLPYQSQRFLARFDLAVRDEAARPPINKVCAHEIFDFSQRCVARENQCRNPARGVRSELPKRGSAVGRRNGAGREMLWRMP